MAGGSSTRFLSEAHGRVGRWLRNKWHLDSLIAIGGMAAVYASTHRNGARAAIKLLHSQYTRNEQARRRFLAEGYAANKVGHRNAVLVLDDDTTEDGEVYLVMELLEGESLEGRLERLGVMGPMEVLAIADQLLEVLACAHPKGILHRDIKPANIYLTRDGSVKLLDFGLARVRELSAEALDQSDGIVFGTVSYIAPEQARADNQNLDSRSDMWSIAATMFRALAGETVHPSTGPIIERLLAVARKPARSIASLAPYLPRPVIELVDRALAFDPEDRWPSANVMRVVVQDVMAQLQEEAEGDEMQVEVQKPAPKQRNNTLPVTTRANKTLDLPTVRPGLGSGAADTGVQRPKTDPVGLSTRPRNLPPSEPAPPDGDETELDLDGLYDKARAAPSTAAPKDAGRSRTLLTKEGRAELRRILDARRAGVSTPEPEAAPETRRARRVAGPDTSGVGDIDVEFEDSIIQVTIDHTHGPRPGPIAERISEPSSVTPAPVALVPLAQSPGRSAVATTPDALDQPEAAASASETYPAIAVEEDEADDVEDALASPTPLAASKPSSNLRPPSVPPQQPVPSDSLAAASSRTPSPSPQSSSAVTRATGRSPQGEITRVGPPPRPAASTESRPAASTEARPAASTESRPAAFGAREITKVGPAPVAPAAPPARESPRPPPRPQAGILHETMRGAATPVAPPGRGPKEESRPATGVTAGLLNETLRPGAAPPPAQSRSGPIPVVRAEGEPAKSTMFAAPVRPGGEAPREASTTARATNFVPPAGRMMNPSTPAAAAAAAAASGPAAVRAASAPNAAALPAAAPNASTLPAAASAPVSASVSAAAPTSSGPAATMRLPSAAPRSTGSAAGQPSASPAPSKATPGDTAGTSKAAPIDTGTSKATPGDTAGTSKAAPIDTAGTSKAATIAATTNPGAGKAATGEAAATSKTATGEAAATSKAATANQAADKATAIGVATSKAASDATTTSKAAAIPTASNATMTGKPATSPGATTLPAAAKPVTSASAAGKPETSTVVGGKPAAVPVVPVASGPITTVPVVPVASGPITVPVMPPRGPIAAPIVAPPVAAAVPAASKSAAPVAAPPPEATPERAPEVAAAPEPAPARAGKSMFNPYPSLAGGARPEGSATAKTASYPAIGAAVPKDSSVVSPNPRTSPNAKTAPHAAAGAAVPKDSTPVPQDSSQGSRTSGPATRTAAYPTVSAEEAKPSEPARGPGKTGAAPVLPFSFLRGGAKPGEPAEPPPEDPNRPGRKKP